MTLDEDINNNKCNLLYSYFFLIRNIDLDLITDVIITSVIINISITVLLSISMILFTFIIDQLHQLFIKPPHHAHYVCAAVTKTLEAPFLHVTHRQQHSCWFLSETAVWGICKVIYDFFHEKLSLEINHSILLSCKKNFNSENWSWCRSKNRSIFLLCCLVCWTGTHERKVSLEYSYTGENSGVMQQYLSFEGIISAPFHNSKPFH